MRGSHPKRERCVLTDNFVIPVAVDVGRASGGVANAQFRYHRLDLRDLSTFLVRSLFSGTADVRSDISCRTIFSH